MKIILSQVLSATNICNKFENGKNDNKSLIFFCAIVTDCCMLSRWVSVRGIFPQRGTVPALHP